MLHSRKIASLKQKYFSCYQEIKFIIDLIIIFDLSQFEMTTLTIQVKDNDTDFLLEVLKRIDAKVIQSSKKQELLNGIKQGIKEAKDIKSGKISSLTLNDI
ncbi:hypothetical protein [Pedobacter sp. N23S346]|uniref:hypothetical protein n=1 Tax=Pedobacter sp. N23S346 TaxID=3402750 RepID=UPI003ACE79E5